MEVCVAIHLAIILCVICIPLMPLKILRQVYFIPAIFPVIWIIFGDCPLNRFHENMDDNSFTKKMLSHVSIDVTTTRASEITNLVVVGTLVASAYKLNLNCKK